MSEFVWTDVVWSSEGRRVYGIGVVDVMDVQLYRKHSNAVTQVKSERAFSRKSKYIPTTYIKISRGFNYSPIQEKYE